MEIQSEVRHQSWLRTLYYWTLLLLILVVVDDLMFGWIFWGLSQINPFFSAGVAFVASWASSYWITLRGLLPEPGRIANFMLSRLQLERKNPELRSRESKLKNQIRSVGIALPMTLLFGGIVTTLWLRRNNVVSDSQAKRLAFWLCGLYAVEFAAVHALGIGGSIFVARS